MTIHLKKQSSRAAIFVAICYFKTRPPSCALGTSFYTVSEGRDLMTYVSDNYTSYSAPSPLNKPSYCFSNLVLGCQVILKKVIELLIHLLIRVCTVQHNLTANNCTNTYW